MGNSSGSLGVGGWGCRAGSCGKLAGCLTAPEEIWGVALLAVSRWLSQSAVVPEVVGCVPSLVRLQFWLALSRSM